MLKLGRAQGVAIAAAMRHGLEVTEYAPRKVKQSITGNGNADKEQVMKMLQTILSFKENVKQYDASDALAVALCHHFQCNTLLGKSSKRINGWDDFIKKNPGRLRKIETILYNTIWADNFTLTQAWSYQFRFFHYVLNSQNQSKIYLFLISFSQDMPAIAQNSFL
jgi:hypothetical protein